MCGLIGYIGKKPFDVDKIKVIMMYNLSRGDNSTGFYTPETGVVKEALSCDSFLALYEIPQSNMLIAHTRLTTIGATTSENAHPFEFEKTFTVHNGTLKNHWDLLSRDNIPSKDFHVDSQVLAYYLQKGWDILRDYDGAIAMLHFKESNPTMLYTYRNTERPLYRGMLDNGYYFSSMEDSLIAVGCKNIKELKSHYLYEFSTNGTIKTAKYTNKPYVKPAVATSTNNFLYNNNFDANDYNIDQSNVYYNRDFVGRLIEKDGWGVIRIGAFTNTLCKVINIESDKITIFIQDQGKLEILSSNLIYLGGIQKNDVVVAIYTGKNKDHIPVILQDNLYQVIDKNWDVQEKSYLLEIKKLNEPDGSIFTWHADRFRLLTPKEQDNFKLATDQGWGEFIDSVQSLSDLTVGAENTEIITPTKNETLRTVPITTPTEEECKTPEAVDMNELLNEAYIIANDLVCAIINTKKNDTLLLTGDDITNMHRLYDIIEILQFQKTEFINCKD